jgi:hypothetical protein
MRSHNIRKPKTLSLSAIADYNRSKVELINATANLAQTVSSCGVAMMMAKKDYPVGGTVRSSEPINIKVDCDSETIKKVVIKSGLHEKLKAYQYKRSQEEPKENVLRALMKAEKPYLSDSDIDLLIEALKTA